MHKDASDLQNDARTCAAPRTPATQRRSRPVRYRLIDKDGVRHGTYGCPDDARMEADRIRLGNPNMSDDVPDGWYLKSTKFKAPKKPQRPPR